MRNFSSLLLTLLAFIVGMGIFHIMPGRCAETDQPMVNGLYPVEPEADKWLTESKYLPTRTTFLTDIELAQKLDLSLPQLGDLKKSVEFKIASPDSPDNDTLLQRALVSYLDSRLPALKVEVVSPPKPVPYSDTPFAPDLWLGSETTFNVNDAKKRYPIGERIPWYHDLMNCDGGLNFEGWSIWGIPLASAYLATGDTKYVEAILTYARSFYKNARPPAQKPETWYGCSGPWQGLSSSGRVHSGYMPWIYRAIAGASVVTDLDKVMFLKMFYEHADYLYLITDKHVPHNFEVHIINGLLNMALTFPEFLNSPAWRERSVERLTQNIQNTVLKDGGSHERTGYHFAYLHPYAYMYSRVRDAGYPMPESFRDALEPMFDWAMWILSPLMQYPNLSMGSPDDMSGTMQQGAELFPERQDFLYLVSGGTKGKPPERTAKVLYHTGFLTMRSSWSKEALYMAMNYNGSPNEAVAYPQLLSFGLWAHGRIYMTNSGTPIGYGHPLFNAWCRHTRSSNTVMIDGKSQSQVTNGGRLENWQSLPLRSSAGTGFNYLVAVSDAYRKLGITHRRAVFFIKPRYWLMHDLLTPADNSNKTHEYRWLGHFQPTELSVEPSTKTVSTGLEDGKRFYLIPLEPDLLELEQGKGVIATPSGKGDGPYIRLMKKSDKPVSFTVLLYPAINNARQPIFEKLEVKKENQSVPCEEAVGCKVICEKDEAIVAIATTAGLRSYGELITDGESGYIRIEDYRIVEAGLVSGSQLSYKGKMILNVGPDIVSVYVRYADNTAYLDVRGNGKVSVDKGSAKELVLNGRSVSARVIQGKFNIEMSSPGLLALTEIAFSTDPALLWKVLVGTPGTFGEKKGVVLVSWKTSVPSDAMIEHAPLEKDTWIKTMNPEPMTDHWMVLSNLMPDETYKLRITCRSDDSAMSTTTVIYRAR